MVETIRKKIKMSYRANEQKRKWYDANKDVINAVRRARYAANRSEVVQKVVQREPDGKETFGERLARLRENRDLARSAVAERTGVAQVAVWRWEKDDTKPTIDNLIKLAYILGTSTDYLLTGKEHSRYAVLMAAVKAAGTRDPRLIALIAEPELVEVKKLEQTKTPVHTHTGSWAMGRRWGS